MKATPFLLVLLTLLVLFLSSTTAFVTVGFYGSTSASGTSWSGPTFGEGSECSNSTGSPYGYTSWQVTFDETNSSMWLVATSGDSNLSGFYGVIIYSTFDPNLPCQGLYNGGIINDVDDGLLTMIKKPVFFAPGTYTFVGGSGYGSLEGDFAVNLISMDHYTVITNSSHTWGPLYAQVPGQSCFGYSQQMSYASYEFTVPSDGYYDIAAAAIPAGNNWLETSVAIYKTTLEEMNYLSDTCNPYLIAGNFLGTTYPYIPNIYLQQGINYTVIASALQPSVYGQVGFQISPTRIVFWRSSPAFVPPIEGYCTNIGITTPWASTAVTPLSKYAIFALDSAEGYFNPFQFEINLYSGLNLGNATTTPATCTNLIGQGTAVATRSLVIGNQYSIVLYSIEGGGDGDASILWQLAGINLNIPTSNPQTGSSSSSSSGSNTGTHTSGSTTGSINSSSSTSNTGSNVSDGTKLFSSFSFFFMVILFLLV